MSRTNMRTAVCSMEFILGKKPKKNLTEQENMFMFLYDEMKHYGETEVIETDDGYQEIDYLESAYDACDDTVKRLAEYGFSMDYINELVLTKKLDTPIGVYTLRDGVLTRDGRECEW